MSKEIEKVLSLYEEILSNKRSLINEADIAGVDELVYNPVTGPNGDLGYGYDDGKKVQGIRWNNHDNHLHIGFTNREAAMKIIDHADSMGLGTSENPYAKKDPNGKVDPGHTENSLHYKTFEGTPPVGAAVDITGDKNKILELIKWVESNFANGGVTYAQTPTKTTAKTPSNTTASSTDSTKQISILNPFSEQEQKYKKIIKEGSIFGPNVYYSYGSAETQQLKDQSIYTPISGKVIDRPYRKGKDCRNSITIKSTDGTRHLQYCGIDKPSVTTYTKVSAKEKIGESNDVLTISMYDKDWNQIKLSLGSTQLTTDKSEENKNPSKDLYSGVTFTDPLLAAAALSPVLLWKYLKRKRKEKKDKENEKKDENTQNPFSSESSSSTSTPSSPSTTSSSTPNTPSTPSTPSTPNNTTGSSVSPKDPNKSKLTYPWDPNWDPNISGTKPNLSSESKSDRNQRRIQENITRIKKLL